MKKSVTNEINTLVPLKGGINLSSIMKSMSASCSVTQSHPTLWNPMDCSTPGFPVLHQSPELAQSHVHRVSDTIQPSHHFKNMSAQLLCITSTTNYPKYSCSKLDNIKVHLLMKRLLQVTLQ